jgi:hypothetical protein
MQTKSNFNLSHSILENQLINYEKARAVKNVRKKNEAVNDFSFTIIVREK